MKKNLFLPAVGALTIAVLVGLLYLPFVSNPFLFDDHAVLSKGAAHDLIKTPFDLRLRTFPYYTLGLVHILFNGIEANRIVNLILHLLCAWVLLLLLEEILGQAQKTTQSIDKPLTIVQPRILALIGATWFAINPVAVYGTGYLAQRTILFATLFSLLSLWYFRRALTENRTSSIVVAALFYSGAVFSKEHAIMLPAAAAILAAPYTGDLRSNAKRIGLFWLLCAPAAITVVLSSLHLIGATYEPSFDAVSGQIHGIPLLDKPHGPWIVSSLIQASFFFDYLTYWIIPNVSTMSIDMRIDFVQAWSAWWLIPKAILFLASPFAGLYLLRQRGLKVLFGCGLLYSWLLYLTEVSSVRFQEPFVLYRSYIWAPGYILMLVAVGSAIPRRWLIALSIPVLVIFFALARERLQSLKSEYIAWNDAAVKLDSEAVPGADRIFYNRGLRYLKAKKFNEALSDFSRAAAVRPSPRYYYHRGVAYYSLNDFTKAAADFDHAFTLNKKDGAIAFARGLVFERLGCIDAAKQAYSTSQDLGYPLAKPRLIIFAKNLSKSEIKHDSGLYTCPL